MKHALKHFSGVKGRGLIATTLFRKGDTVLVEEAVTATLNPILESKQQYCHHCFRMHGPTPTTIRTTDTTTTTDAEKTVSTATNNAQSYCSTQCTTNAQVSHQSLLDKCSRTTTFNPTQTRRFPRMIAQLVAQSITSPGVDHDFHL